MTYKDTNSVKLLLLAASIIFILAGCGSDSTGTPDTAPTVTTASPTAVAQRTAQCGGNVVSDGGANVTARGICWATTADPTVADDTTNNGNGLGNYSSNLTGLTPSTTYHVRAYAINSIGTAYGDDSSFTTLALAAPTVATGSAINISYTTALSGGNITSDGGADISARGVCWGTSHDPTVANDTTNNGTGTGAFTSNITGLTPNTTYYIRAYAINSQGTSYGSEMSFSTLAYSVPDLTVAEATSISYTSADVDVEFVTGGGVAVTARGVCWSTSHDPTIADDTTNNGTGETAFTASLTGLTANTTYYVRAYATNGIGTGYSDEISFTTLAYTVPELTTTEISNISSSSAQSGGEITSSGGKTIIGRGVCWSETENPTIADNVSTDGSGTGTYTSDITGLSGGTLYYVRAYATNSEGTGYGDELTFTTLAVVAPTVQTNSIVTRTLTTSRGSASPTSSGGAAITSAGFCWSTSQNPTIADDTTNEGSLSSTFTSDITGLTEGTTYYGRAYATNSVGTGYGDQILFKGGRVIDYDDNEYTIVQIGTQWWLGENLKVTHYADGDAIDNVTDNSAWEGLSTGAYCDYNNESSNVDTYGRLYNFYAVDDARELAPEGWHVASDAEWKQMEISLGMSQVSSDSTGYRGSDEGGKLKESGLSHWLDPNTGATDEVGFTALPAGYRDGTGVSGTLESYGMFWTATEDNDFNAWSRQLAADHADINRMQYGKTYGFSVRCVRDN